MNRKKKSQKPVRKIATATVIKAEVGVPAFGVKWEDAFASHFARMVEESKHKITVDAVGIRYDGEQIRESDGKALPTVKIYSLRITAGPEPYKMSKKELMKLFKKYANKHGRFAKEVEN